MKISGSSSAATGVVANAPQVKVLNSQRDQLEAVVGKLLEGVAEVSKAVAGKGQSLNIKA
jgi:hypothetical protein